MHESIYTVGHSSHTLDRFIRLIRMHSITAIADVRSTPYSRLHPHFNREELKPALKAAGIEYVYLGKELGARSDEPSCYENGKIQYARLAETALFQQGLERVREGMTGFRVSLMCAEKEPLDCHRTILVARHLVALGIAAQHIQADGVLESHPAAVNRLVSILGLPESDLFRSNSDIVEDAYQIQGARIAYTIRTADVESSMTRTAVR